MTYKGASPEKPAKAWANETSGRLFAGPVLSGRAFFKTMAGFFCMNKKNGQRPSWLHPVGDPSRNRDSVLGPHSSMPQPGGSSGRVITPCSSRCGTVAVKTGKALPQSRHPCHAQSRVSSGGPLGPPAWTRTGRQRNYTTKSDKKVADRPIEC